MAKKSIQAKESNTTNIVKKLKKLYPEADCSLEHKTPYQLLISTILSAQCTDARVNMVTPALFKRFPDAKSMAKAKISELEKLVHSTGFYKNKAKSLKASSQSIQKNFGGKVPKSMDELLSLHGVARKTANVVLGNAFGLNEGIVVDTHVLRLSMRLGFVQQNKNRDKVERDLMEVLPKKDWTIISHLLILHGRNSCKAPTPHCSTCKLESLCPKIDVKKNK